jgi:hypothetical protein
MDTRQPLKRAPGPPPAVIEENPQASLGARGAGVGGAVCAARDRATGGQRGQRMDGGYGGIIRPLQDPDGAVATKGEGIPHGLTALLHRVREGFAAPN